MTPESYYKFIQPVSMVPRTPYVAVGRTDVLGAIEKITSSRPTHVHYDLETTGLVYADPNQIITTVGLATPDWLVGLDLVDLSYAEQQPLWDWLGAQRLGGFNLGFDLAWPWRTPTGDGRVNPNVSDKHVVSDTSLWFRLLGTEAHFLQKYGLEEGVIRILRWPEEHQQKSWLKDALSRHQIKKVEMWKLALLETHKYTEYCALDAEASFQLDIAFQATLKHWSFEGLQKYHDDILVPKVKRNILAGCHGIPVDREKLKRNIEWCQRRMLALEAEALEHPFLKPLMDEFTANKLKKTHKLKFNLKKIKAKASDKPWLEPDKYRISYVTDPEKRAKLPKWCREFGGTFYKPETQFTISQSKSEWPRFNVSSPADMKWLLYDNLLGGYYDKKKNPTGKYTVWYRNPANPKAGGLVTIKYDGRTYELNLTDSGGLPTGGPVLTIFGEAGRLIAEYKSLKKLLGDFLEKFELASRRTGYVHHQSKVLGAVTGRMSGGS